MKTLIPGSQTYSLKNEQFETVCVQKRSKELTWFLLANSKFCAQKNGLNWKTFWREKESFEIFWVHRAYCGLKGSGIKRASWRSEGLKRPHRGPESSSTLFFWDKEGGLKCAQNFIKKVSPE